MGKGHKKKVKEPKKVKKEKEEDAEEVDYNQLARTELLKLQRQYRLMQGTQHAFAEEAGTTIFRQHRIMRLLNAEKDNLETDYKNAACPKNKDDDISSRAHITKLMQTYDDYQARIKAAIETIEEMESQVDKIMQRVVSQNLKMQSLFGMSLTAAMATKRLRTLENRLYQMTTRYDTLVSENVYLRSDINTILMERGRYHKRSMFIKRCVSNMKKRMMDIVDVATQIYEARDEYATKIKILRERDDKESRQHVLELKEWQRVLHDDGKQHTFMATKFQDRDVIEADVDRENRHQIEQDKLLDYILMKYKKSFKAIISLGVSKDVESLVHDYMDKDLTNFTTFKYISDINNEIEVIRDSITSLKEEIQNLEECSGERQATQIQDIKEKKDELDKIRNNLETLDNELFKYGEGLNDDVTEFEKIFNLLHCDNESIIRLLGNSEGMNALNVHLCVTVIENTITELVRDRNILHLRKHVEKDGKPLPSKQANAFSGGDKAKAQGGPFKPKVLISGRMDSAGDDENNENEKLMSSCRLTYEQLKESIMEKMRQSAIDAPDTTEVSSRNSLVGESETPSSMSIYPIVPDGKSEAPKETDAKSETPKEASPESDGKSSKVSDRKSSKESDRKGSDTEGSDSEP